MQERNIETIINKGGITSSKMKYKTILFVVLLVGIMLVAGCTKSSSSGYATYNPQQGQQQPYVGGGCGVAPIDNLDDSSASIGSVPSNL